MRQLLAYPMRLLNGFLDRAFALAGALLLAQFPQFYSQYIQRLGGHLDEARRTVDLYSKNAALLGLTLEQYIEHHLGSKSEVFVSTGRIIVSLLERLQRLESSFAALVEAPPWMRPWVFLKEVQLPIAAQAWRDFTPGIPTTMEGFIYAAAGLLLGWSCYSLARWIVRKLAGLFKKSPCGQPETPDYEKCPYGNAR
ncbi:MAG: DUF2937 family protein [Firmicutes bacterium]|jgi:hypothetical protein|nr:DUF2937 family protein [Bacillota bacterium]HPU00810.1 DUF2937 family protein [Bacillota bacterium]